jgi:hypothetical protein
MHRGFLGASVVKIALVSDYFLETMWSQANLVLRQTFGVMEV